MVDCRGCELPQVLGEWSGNTRQMAERFALEDSLKCNYYKFTSTQQLLRTSSYRVIYHGGGCCSSTSWTNTDNEVPTGGL